VSVRWGWLGGAEIGRTLAAPVAVLMGSGLLLAACGPWRPPETPSIEITRIPPAAPGGTTRLDTIEGRAIGARYGQRIVLYAHSGAWYVQPFVDQPFTPIGPDGTWKSSTHLGTDYGALLVDAGYRPAATLDALPAPGAGVVVVVRVPGEPELWRRRWVQLSGLAAGAAAALGLHRFRLQALTRRLHLRAEERLAERTRIAQELYDALWQGFLSAWMQLHLVADELPDGSPQKPRLDRVLRTMGQVIDEGRNVLYGLRTPGGDAEPIEGSLSRIARQLDAEGAVGFRVNVEGSPRDLHPIIREEVCRVGREALTNAFRHSRARRIDLEIHYSGRVVRLVVRDDGCGFAARRRPSAGQCGAGLFGMRVRAERIGARLRVRSRPGAGTEIVVSVPGRIAFQPHSAAHEAGE